MRMRSSCTRRRKRETRTRVCISSYIIAEMFFKTSLLFYCTIWSVVQLMHLATSYPHPTRSCLNMPELHCANSIGGGYTISPNVIGLTYEAALGEFLSFSQLLELNNYCSYLAHIFLCLHYFPPCAPGQPVPILVLPCRQLCEEAWEECLDYIYYSILNTTAPEHLECTNFPIEANETDDFIVACPDPGKSHLACGQ